MTADEIAKCIPDEVVARTRELLSSLLYSARDDNERFRAALAAGLAAWPGIQHIVWDGQLILHLKAPLPLKEKTDGK